MSQQFLPELTIVDDGIDMSAPVLEQTSNLSSANQSSSSIDSLLVDNLTEASLEAGGNDTEVANRVVAAAFKSVGFGPMLDVLQGKG